MKLHTMIEFSEFHISVTKNKPDRLTASMLLRYFTENINKKISDFGKVDFLELHTYISESSTHKTTYRHLVAIRRFMIETHNDGTEFAIHPKLFKTPKKSSPSHFSPLSSEELKTLSDFLISKINDIYAKENAFYKAQTTGKPINKNNSNFIKHSRKTETESFWKWQISLIDCIYQIHLEHPHFPNNATEKELGPGGKYAVIRKIDYELLDTPFKLIFKRFGVQRLSGSRPFIYDAEKTNFIDLLGFIYPRVFETYIIIWAICLETGWSQDMVERIDFKNYIYSPIPIDSDTVFIKTIKLKGVTKGNTIKQAKEFIHPSSKSKSTSAYNLIRLFVNRSSRLRSGEAYNFIVEELGTEPFIIYLNESAGKKIIYSHPEQKNTKGSLTRARYINENLGFDFDVRQLRPTCLYLRETEQNLPLLLQVALFGHSSSSITDEFYKDSEPFRQIRKDKLAKELVEIQKSVHDGSFKGTLVTLRNTKLIREKIITIFTDHSGESPIAVCTDSTRPDWFGWEIEIKSKGECRHFNKCLLCSRSTVFSDNIPFIVDRFIYIEKQRRKIREDTFLKLYVDEYLALKEVIDNWPYPADIEEAELRTVLDGYLLPPIISECKL